MRLSLFQFDASADFRYGRRVFGLACLEYFRHTRQTARDILRSAGGPRLMSKQLARLDLLAFRHFYSGAGRQIVNIKNLAVGILNHNLRVLVALVLDYDGFARSVLCALLQAESFRLR